MAATAKCIEPEIQFFDYERHMSGVFSIERLQFGPNAMSRNDLRCCMADRKNAGRVLVCRGEVIAFIIERFHTFDVEILKVAVDPMFERLGFATKLIRNAIVRASRNVGSKRRRIFTNVAESNLPAQLLLRSCGFIWVQTIRGTSHQGSFDDNYQFVTVLDNRA